MDRLSGSLSAIHKPSGLHFTIASGHDDRTDRNPKFVYGKLGWRPELTTVGVTAFAFDAFKGADMAVGGSDSLSIGLAVVQTFGYYQTDLFATGRWYDFDDPTVSYESSFALLTGARIRF